MPGKIACVWVYSWQPRDADEMRKRLFSLALESAELAVIENVTRITGEPASILSSAVTSRTFRDRILGQSRTASPPWRTLVVITGNNSRLNQESVAASTVAAWMRRWSFRSCGVSSAIMITSSPGHSGTGIVCWLLWTAWFAPGSSRVSHKPLRRS